MNTVDIHAHIIWDIDDGADTVETSVAMLRMAAADGITHMVATPHYIGRACNYKSDDILEKVAALNNVAEEADLPIRLHAGNEIFADPEGIAALKAGNALPLAGSRYALIEFSGELTRDAVLSIAECVLAMHRIPIVAHAERSIVGPGKQEFLQQLVEKGALLQLDASSVTGDFGWMLYHHAKRILKSGMVFAVASDGHNTSARPPHLSRAYEEVTHVLNEKAAEALFYTNPMRVIQNL